MADCRRIGHQTGNETDETDAEMVSADHAGGDGPCLGLRAGGSVAWLRSAAPGPCEALHRSEHRMADQGEIRRACRACRAYRRGVRVPHGTIQSVPVDRQEVDCTSERHGRNDQVRQVPAHLRACLRRHLCGGARTCRNVRTAMVSRGGVRLAVLEKREDRIVDALPLPLQSDQLLALPFYRCRCAGVHDIGYNTRS